MHDVPDIRTRMAAAAVRIRRLKRIDRAAVSFITLGGIAVIIGVIGILAFIAWEAVPLFRGARATETSSGPMASAVFAEGASPGLRAIGADEYSEHLYTVEPDGTVVLWSFSTGQRERAFPLPGLEGAVVIASSRSSLGDYMAGATNDGRVALAQLRVQPIFDGQTQKGVEVQLRERGLVELDPARRPVVAVSYREDDNGKMVAGLVGDHEIALWWSDADGVERRAALRTDAPDRITQIAVGRTTHVVAATATGKVFHWELQDDEPRLTNVSTVGSAPVTAMAFALGDNTLIVGDAAGAVSGWFSVRLESEDDRQAMVRVHSFEPHGAPVVALSPSTRDKSFISAGADGSVALRHLTSQQTLVALPTQPAAVVHAFITPRADGAVTTLANGTVARFSLSNPHPESTLQTLFGKVWYEGYSEPEYVWQSTGATDDFEAKFSLVPLIFGTIKGTVYALLFAVPLSVLGALYTSQFAHPNIRARIKPTVEIMAALPSVVIGFIAGLWLASIVERNLVAVIVGIPVVLVSGTLGILVWRLLPRTLSSRVKAGTELLVIVPLLVAGAALATLVAPGIEAVFFDGDMRLWLNTIGFTYDQRNSLVVGLAMGFAVIPIIFTISDDALQAVPPSLTAASLALGASRWQTATRVVLPTASPGIFSAAMVGFGRAIGETMIVLMATGNTPLMDWSMFNGMRTLSANIAVEIMEAPLGGTLYRILFLSAALLFALTFIVNTIAELIRQRLRDKYKAI